MCQHKVKVKNRYRPSAPADWFNCGKCIPCLQEKANRRSQKIRMHKVDNHTCYFITLHYYNSCIPYVDLNDLLECYRFVEHEENFKIDTFDIPIYRDALLCRGVKSKGKHLKHRHRVLIGHQLIDYKEFNSAEIPNLKTIRYKYGIDNYKLDSHRVSVCFSKDFRDFIKRLRIDFERIYRKRQSISYYYAPEYGPTWSRFHIHALLWFPSELSEDQVKDLICQAWKFGDEKRTRKYVEVARAAQSYVSQYVNCSPDVSEWLWKNFALKPSHSFHFGFGSTAFEPDTIVTKYLQNRCTTYDVMHITSDGKFQIDTKFLPKYVVSRYFPKFKGFSILSRQSATDVIANPEKYLSLSSQPCGYTPNGDPLYLSNVRDRYGNAVAYSEVLSNHTIKKIKYALSVLTPLLGSKQDAARLIVDFNINYMLNLYKRSQTDPDIDNPLYEFNNLNYANSFPFNCPTVVASEFFDLSVKDCNLYPPIIERDERLTEKYRRNVKQRKVNSL